MDIYINISVYAVLAIAAAVVLFAWIVNRK